MPEPLAPFLSGITVADRGGRRATAMAAALLADLGASATEADDADVVLAPSTRPAGATARVWVCVTPFGATGPRSAWRATDLGVVAASGNLFATGDPDRAPVRCAGDAGDAHCSAEIAYAALTGLAAADAGDPIDVDLSMQEVVVVANMGGVGRYFRSGFRGRRIGANIGRTREIWPCADGWVSFGLRGGPARVPSLQTIAAAVGSPILTERDWTKWDVTTATDEELAEVEGAVGGWFATRTMAELYELACATNLMLAPVNTAREMYASAQLAAREFFDADGAPRRWCHPRIAANGFRSGAAGRGVRGAEPLVGGAPRSAGGPAALAGGDNALDPAVGRFGQAPSGKALSARESWAGTRIIELGAGAAGPIGSRYFAEHGATVLRIESASRPDFLRASQYADLFDALNCGKRSVSLNLKHPEGRALAIRLVVEWADALLENYAPKALRGLGLTYDDLVAHRPDLVMVSACLNGQTGPHRDYPGFGGQGAALAGFNHLTGWPDREPVGPFGTITDSLAPRFVATALAGALLHHRRTGQGAYVDISQVECAIWTLAPVLEHYRRDGVIDERRGNDHPGALVHGVYRCAGDDRWVAVAAWTPAELAALESVTNGDDIETWASTRRPLDCAEALQAAGVEAVPVQDFGDVHDDPQLAHRAHLIALDDPGLGPGHYERNGFRLARPDGPLPSGYDRSAPQLGQDTDMVLSDILGLSTADQDRLRADGAFH